ncbi:hypothetical protein GCM10022205_01530 [Spinactinospora alkalitolerans]
MRAGLGFCRSTAGGCQPGRAAPVRRIQSGVIAPMPHVLRDARGGGGRPRAGAPPAGAFTTAATYVFNRSSACVRQCADAIRTHDIGRFPGLGPEPWIRLLPTHP